MTNNDESSVYYHDRNVDDPFVNDHNRPPVEDDYWACFSCDCNDALATSCRCSCHSQRRHH